MSANKNDDDDDDDDDNDTKAYTGKKYVNRKAKTSKTNSFHQPARKPDKSEQKPRS